MKTIYFFNPESDYALASNSVSYTPPPPVVEVRRENQMCQISLMKDGDVILLADEPNMFADNALRFGTERFLIPYDQIHEFAKEVAQNPSDYRIIPWGWNKAVKHFFLRNGFPESLLPTDEQLAHYRNLSHRRTTIDFNIGLNKRLAKAGYDDKHLSPVPLEFNDTDEAMDWIRNHPNSFVKAPWSSSGRGVLNTASGMSIEKIEEWISGTIRRQGSVLIEEAADNVLDFATEWYITGDDVHFLGLSTFRTDKDGKYQRNGNYSGDTVGKQTSMMWEIQKYAYDFDQHYIDYQRFTIKEVIKGYEGFLGIDMLADSNGGIRGCVEINLRMTMGIVSLGKLIKSVSW